MYLEVPLGGHVGCGALDSSSYMGVLLCGSTMEEGDPGPSRSGCEGCPSLCWGVLDLLRWSIEGGPIPVSAGPTSMIPLLIGPLGWFWGTGLCGGPRYHLTTCVHRDPRGWAEMPQEQPPTVPGAASSGGKW